MNTSEHRKVKQFADKIRPMLVALVAEAKIEQGNVDYAIDATMSLVLIAAYGIFKEKEQE